MLLIPLSGKAVLIGFTRTNEATFGMKGQLLNTQEIYFGSKDLLK